MRIPSTLPYLVLVLLCRIVLLSRMQGHANLSKLSAFSCLWYSKLSAMKGVMDNQHSTIDYRYLIGFIRGNS